MSFEPDYAQAGQTPLGPPPGHNLLPAFLRQGTTPRIQTQQAVHAQAMITAFRPDRDTLLCIWDDSQNPDPPNEITLQPDPRNPDLLLVVSGGQILAKVQAETPVTEAELTLMPISAARQIGLPTSAAMQ